LQYRTDEPACSGQCDLHGTPPGFVSLIKQYSLLFCYLVLLV
jgi:hypothetical protein